MISDNFLIKLYGLSSSTTSIKRFKQLALDLAVSGRLLPQDAKDEHANVTLGKASVGLLPLPGKNAYRNLVGWSKINLGCAIKSNTGGGTPPRNDPSCWNGSIPWASVKDIGKSKHISATEETITQSGLDCCSSNLIPAGRLIVVTRMGLGKLAVNTVPMAINQDLRAIEPTEALDLNFAYLLFKSLKLVGSGVTVKGITVQKLHEIEVGIPPLAEQKRIVAKVDELMALCDRLEAQLKERDVKQAALAKAALAKFAEDPTPENLQLLFHPSFSIETKNLRELVLNLAIKGRLGTQNPNDESAKLLLARINATRTTMLKDGYPNRDEASTQLRKQETQAIPEGLSSIAPGWKWATLLQTSLLIVDCHNKTAPYVEKGVHLLRTTNIREGRLNLNEAKYVTNETYERWSARCKPEPGDLIITREAPMGEACIIPEGMKVCLGQRMMLIRLVPGTIEDKYLLYTLMAADLMDRIQDKPVGATVQHLRVGGVETLLTPIPPLAEQQRIVKRVNQLMVLIDTLEAQLDASRTTGEKLLEAMVAELTSA